VITWHQACGAIGTVSTKSIMPPAATLVIRRIAAIAAAIAVLGLFVKTDTARAAWGPIVRFLSLQGPPVPASANVLSEHEIELLDSMPAQNQATLLLERSINHYQGANEQIARRVSRWRGQLTLEGRLNELFITALNSDDLRVRAAAIEVNLVARNVEKSVEAVYRLEPIARFGEQGPRVNALWDLALVGNRGVETARIEQILLASLHDPNENIRYWTVEGLPYLATDTVIQPLLEVFHDDPSPLIRERAACGLAQSGMLNDEQRRRAIPRLLDYAGDGGLDPETRKWVFQALRDITGQTLPHDASAWRAWYRAER
jgi:HEAT repeats